VIEVRMIYDLPIRVACASEVECLSIVQGIDSWQALEQIIRDWHDLTFESPGGQHPLPLKDEESVESHDNPLDAIEAKLERISRLCDQVIRKLDSSNLDGI
jgi:hypothetical protein